MRILVFVLVLFAASNVLLAQEVEETIDTTFVEEFDEEILQTKKLSKRKQKIQSKFYNPRVASKRSALIPGWGQIYNDSWWKVPVLYGGLGISLYFVNFNENNRNELLARADEELAQDIPDQNRLRVFRRQADQWRRNRDLVILTMFGIYGLQIIDAAVDAHLKGFNVDEDLALNLKPKFGVISNGSPYLGVGITLPIGK